jgi:mannose-6-phosphate isomerase-like protein (cupin superfamily)
MPRPSIELRAPIEVGPRDWGREVLIAQTDAYIGKVLLMKAGTAGGLQYHKTKIETFFLDEGQAFVDYDANGTLTTISMSPGMIVHVPAGAPHRVRAVSDCKFFEVSTPVFNDRVRVEAEYGEPEGGGLPTT